MVTSFARTGVRLALAATGHFALTACEPVPIGSTGSSYLRVMPVIEPPRRPSRPASWYGPGRSVSQMISASAECEARAERTVWPGAEPGLHRQILEQCMSDQGFRAVDLPECSDRVRNAALRAGPSGRTVMPPLAPDACIMTLPDGAQPILPNPSEYF